MKYSPASFLSFGNAPLWPAGTIRYLPRFPRSGPGPPCVFRSETVKTFALVLGSSSLRIQLRTVRPARLPFQPESYLLVSPKM